MSDIIYVGSTPKGGTICERLRDHLLTRENQKVVGWKIERVLKAVGPLEVAWKVFSTADQAANYESEILWRYEKDHIELPPLNSQMPQRTDRLNEEVVQQELNQLPAERVANLLSNLDPTKLREVRAILVTMGKLEERGSGTLSREPGVPHRVFQSELRHGPEDPSLRTIGPVEGSHGQ